MRTRILFSLLAITYFPVLTAQLSVAVETAYGAAIEDGPGPDTWGNKTSLGVSLLYAVKSRFFDQLRLTAAYHRTGGLVSVRHFNEVVDPFETVDPPTIVSLRAYVPDYRSVSLGVALEGPFFVDRWPRLRGSGGVGVIRNQRRSPTIEWYEQSLDGEQLGPFGLFDSDQFLLADGRITRWSPSRPDLQETYFVANALKRYQVYLDSRLGYELTSYLQVSIQYTAIIGTVGKRYSDGDAGALLGWMEYLQFGVAATL
jgi:hypothetical protein